MEECRPNALVSGVRCLLKVGELLRGNAELSLQVTRDVRLILSIVVVVVVNGEMHGGGGGVGDRTPNKLFLVNTLRQTRPLILAAI